MKFLIRNYLMVFIIATLSSLTVFANNSSLNGIWGGPTVCGEFKIENTYLTDFFRLKDNKDRVLLEFNNGVNTHGRKTLVAWSPTCKYLIIYVPGLVKYNWMGLTLVNTKTLNIVQPKNMEKPIIKGETFFPERAAIDDFGKYIAFTSDIYKNKSGPGRYGVVSYWNIETGKMFLNIDKENSYRLTVRFAEGSSSMAIENENGKLIARNIEDGTTPYKSTYNPSRKVGNFLWGKHENGSDRYYGGYQFVIINSSDLKYRAELFALNSSPFLIGVDIYYNGPSKYIQPALKRVVLQTNGLCAKGSGGLSHACSSKELFAEYFYDSLDTFFSSAYDRSVIHKINNQMNAYFMNDQLFIRTDPSDLQKVVAIDIL